MSDNKIVEFEINRDPDTVANFLVHEIEDSLRKGSKEGQYDYYTSKGELIASGLRLSKSIDHSDPHFLFVTLEKGQILQLFEGVDRQDLILLMFKILSPIPAFTSEKTSNETVKVSAFLYETNEDAEVDRLFHCILIKTWNEFDSAKKALGQYLDDAARKPNSEKWSKVWEKTKTIYYLDRQSGGQVASDSKELTYLPKRPTTLRKWRRYYDVIIDTRNNFRDEHESGNIENPKPKLEDYKDAIMNEELEPLSDNWLGKIIEAGDLGHLSDS